MELELGQEPGTSRCIDGDECRGGVRGYRTIGARATFAGRCSSAHSRLQSVFLLRCLLRERSYVSEQCERGEANAPYGGRSLVLTSGPNAEANSGYPKQQNGRIAVEPAEDRYDP